MIDCFYVVPVFVAEGPAGDPNRHLREWFADRRALQLGERFTVLMAASHPSAPTATPEEGRALLRALAARPTCDTPTALKALELFAASSEKPTVATFIAGIDRWLSRAIEQHEPPGRSL